MAKLTKSQPKEKTKKTDEKDALKKAKIASKASVSKEKIDKTGEKKKSAAGKTASVKKADNKDKKETTKKPVVKEVKKTAVKAVKKTEVKPVKKAAVKKTAEKKPAAKKIIEAIKTIAKKGSEPKKTAESKKTVDSKKPAETKKAVSKPVENESKIKKSPEKKPVEIKAKKVVKDSYIKVSGDKSSSAKPSVKKELPKKIVKIKPVIKADEKHSENTDMEEHRIIQTKFELESPAACVEPVLKFDEPNELPESYNETKITFLVRDPEWAFVYWDISQYTREQLNIVKGQHNRDMALRIYDITGVKFDGGNAVSWFDIQINDYAISWYIKLPESGRAYVVDIGFYSDQGIFQTIARSNAVTAPPNGISTQTDEEWMHITEETFLELFRLSGGLKSRDELTGSEEISKMINRKLREGLFSGSLSSGALYSESAPQKKIKGFWLIADAELIVYGATEPTAKVTVQGKAVKLTKQGTFSMRFALPDGLKNIPIIAVNESGDDTRKITIEVTRKTS